MRSTVDLQVERRPGYCPLASLIPVLVLLPPSEGKASGTDGAPLDLEALSFPGLTKPRKKVLGALVRAAKRQRTALQHALQLSAGQRGELDKDRDLMVAPTLPTMELYT